MLFPHDLINTCLKLSGSFGYSVFRLLRILCQNEMTEEEVVPQPLIFDPWPTLLSLPTLNSRISEFPSQMTPDLLPVIWQSSS